MSVNPNLVLQGLISLMAIYQDLRRSGTQFDEKTQAELDKMLQEETERKANEPDLVGWRPGSDATE